MIILGDDRPRRRIGRPWATWGLIAVTLVQFALSLAVPTLDDLLAYRPDMGIDLRLLGHAFAHGGFLHLGGNLLFLWVFGDNVEDAMGHVTFLIFYLACAAGGALAYGLFAADGTALIGASGAISGVMAAYLLLHPHARILILAFAKIPLLIPASWVVGLQIGVNLVMIAAGTGSNVAWWAHIGGFAAGFALLIPLKHSEVPLFAAHEAPVDAEFPKLRKFLIDFSGKPRWDAKWALLAKALGYLVVMIALDRLLLS
jgi:membrane associated rhomboid family serine protease